MVGRMTCFSTKSTVDSVDRLHAVGDQALLVLRAGDQEHHDREHEREDRDERDLVEGEDRAVGEPVRPLDDVLDGWELHCCEH